jgi:class 3 adenylate cyclase/predicted ATPase
MASLQWCFADFRLDADNACLWRGTQPIALTPKAFDVLHYFVTHPDRLVTKDTLLDAVWPETAVSEAVVRIAIGELRRALGDTVQTPRFIATVPRRGYRFVAPVVEYAATVPGPTDAPPLETSDMPHASPRQHPGGLLLPTLSLSAAERRHLSVLFCDLVGSTALATRLDPEDYRDVVRAYHQICAEVMQRFDGTVAQYLGDGVLVYFGYPRAHEDDAQRAVRAGLALVDMLAMQPPHPALPSGEPLAVRLGVHTGLVVIGDVGAGAHHEALALGETPNVAARLQHLAEPNTLLISATTQQLVAGYFRCKALGAHTLSGLAQPMEVYRVLGTSGMQSRLQVAATHGLTPLVGRAQEVGLLTECWTRVTEGLGQVVLLTGEAGIGKSRLVQVLKTHVTDAGQPWLEAQGSPYYQHTALYPLIEVVLRCLLHVEPEASAAQKVQHLEVFLVQQGLALTELMPLLAPLLSLPLPVTYAPVQGSPEQQRQQTLHALLRLVLHLAARQPLLLVVEDLHWVDPSTLEWLSLLVDQGPTARILALCTCRPEFTPPWTGRSHCTQVTLTRLPQHQATELTHQVAQGKALPAEVVAQIVAKTDGVPLFVEELTKTVLESGLLQEQAAHYVLTGPLPPLAIPVTLHDALLARLDRLGTAKGLAQLGATLGREFSYALLHAVAPWDEATVRQELQRLVEAELLYQRGLPPQATYVFKHALIQEAAYQLLLKQTRQQYHQHIAQVLAEQFPETAKTQPELLAHHYTEAGLTEQAIPYWQRAGENASNRSANVEAVSHFTIGIELLKTLPETPERTQHTLTLYIALGAALLITKGQAAPEVEYAYTRAHELCQQVGETPELVPVLFGLWRCYSVRPQLHTARELGETLLRLAQCTDDPALAVIAHNAFGATQVCLGAFPAARQHLEEGIARYTPDQRRTPVFRLGHDLGVGCRAIAAVTLWLLGYPEQAQARLHDALTLAHELSHAFSLAYAQCLAAFVSQFLRDVPAVHDHAEAVVALATEQGFPFYGAWGTILRGWALAMQGQDKESVAQVHQGLAAWRATGAGLFVPYLYTVLADVSAHLGHPADGLQTLAEAHTLVEQHEERWWEAEIYRLRGVLLVRQPVTPQAEAETWLRRALDVARRQEAKSLELRAAMSLSRLWQHQGKRAEAYELLAPIYSWFTEGFDTADLQEAKPLLAALV